MLGAQGIAAAITLCWRILCVLCGVSNCRAWMCTTPWI